MVCGQCPPYRLILQVNTDAWQYLGNVGTADDHFQVTAETGLIDLDIAAITETWATAIERLTENNESSDRLNRLERLMEQQIINTADLTQQIKEISVQIKAQATFHDRFEQELSTTRKLIESNAKAIAANRTSIDSERKAIKELRRNIRDSRLDNLDRHRDHQERTNALYDSLDDLQDDIKEIGKKIDRKNLSED